MFIADGARIKVPDYDDEYRRDCEYIAVGWLGRYEPYPKGVVPDGFLDLLKSLAFGTRTRQTRGIHVCEHCSDGYVEIEQDSDVMTLGSAEIWIPANDKKVFAAPNLIIHYVRDHGYLPPPEFIHAVMKLA